MDLRPQVFARAVSRLRDHSRYSKAVTRSKETRVKKMETVSVMMNVARDITSLPSLSKFGHCGVAVVSIAGASRDRE